MGAPSNDETTEVLKGKRVALVGRLASMSKREAGRLVRQHGGVVVEKPDPSVDLVVLGEEELPLGGAADLEGLFDQHTREAADRGTLVVLPETELWQQLGLVEGEQEARRLYTPAMLAELLGVPVAVIRRWHRRGLIVPVREVRRLAYFDFREVATARRLAELLAAGTSPRAIEKKLEALGRYVPGVERPLAQLSVIIEGKEILLRQGDGLIEPGGQLRFDFDAAEVTETLPEESGESTDGADRVVSMSEQGEGDEAPTSVEQMCRMAAELEDGGQLEAAADTYRAALAAAGPVPEICFQVAELLYRLGDLSGARERYYMAVELDEDYVEARANLGCVLAELGQRELAVAAFQGALVYHEDYGDVHYHLARTLDELGRGDEAESHWQAFLDHAPDSPWADQARGRLAGRPPE
ncbi:MAG: MerR family transcriptional regulator [Planctomycetes bacterium]|nr:MerR family transcriptional regulator [Planctomycetota bacterium]